MGRGNYVPDFNGANGKVYKWVQPLNGVLQGDFEPATFLVTPKVQQLVTVAAIYELSQKTTFASEVAISNYDINALSNFIADAENVIGFDPFKNLVSFIESFTKNK
jgi:hypothetical protein